MFDYTSEVICSFCRSEYPFNCQPVLYYDFDKMCRGEIFDESGSGNNGISRGRVIVEEGYNQDNGVDLSDGFIQLDGMNFKVWWGMLKVILTKLSMRGGLIVRAHISGSTSRDRAVRVRVLTKDIVLCSWARHFTLIVPLFTQVYKMDTGGFNTAGEEGNPEMD